MRLIDADALIEDIEEYQKSMVFHSHSERMHFDDMIDFAVDHIEEAPAIDAVPVVRCRECQYGDQNTCGDGYWCWKYGIGVSEDHFCAKGVKVEGESNESE